eukprot:scaffold709358_cov94-Attheya_sp.AAC.1
MVAWFNVDDDDDDDMLLLKGSKVGVDVVAAVGVAVVVMTGAAIDCEDDDEDDVLLLNGSNTASAVGAAFGVGKEANEEEACGGSCCRGGG